VLAISITVLMAPAALAHHSYGEFDLQHPVTIQGTLQQVVIRNPHGVLRILSSDGQVYTAEWANAQQLVQTGIRAGMLRAGDHVVVTGCPMRDRSFHTLALLTEVRRPADGWRWSLSGVQTTAPK
jgi:hypothetical protein